MRTRFSLPMLLLLAGSGAPSPQTSPWVQDPVRTTTRPSAVASRPTTASQPMAASRRTGAPPWHATPTTPGPSGPSTPGPGYSRTHGGAYRGPGDVATGSDDFFLGGSPGGFPLRDRNAEGSTAAFAGLPEVGFVAVEDQPLSTFSVDVDTASYAIVRKFLNQGRLPPPGAVRIEDLLNYFRYAYPEAGAGVPFSVTSEMGECPWNQEHRLVLFGLRGREIAQRVLPPRNLTFLLDVSGSMTPQDRLPLVQSAMRMLVRTLRQQDHVAIVVYAGSSGLVLPPTSGLEQATIEDAITNLRAGGSTNGGAGISLAYAVTRQHFDKEGINRVILATDGDFNVGVTSNDELVRLIERERESGVFLTVLGVGDDNLQDGRMKQLAKNGNGNYAYLDSLQEAHKVLVREAGATLVTIAKDVKLQIEFNPAKVASYRLIGYENRRLRNRDFNDDKKDAGEIGAGHTVTALYEIVPVGAKGSLEVDPLKYQRMPDLTPAATSSEVLNLKLRYKEPDGIASKLLVTPLEDRVSASANLRFASGVAAFGMLLLDSAHKGTANWSMVGDLVRFDPSAAAPERAELERLVALAAELAAQRARIGAPLRSR